MGSRLTSSHLVGRIGELAELQLAVREATFGRPTLVLLGGDSGVGKTRLIAEFERRLTAEEPDGERADMDPAPLVLRGDGVDQDGGDLPYAPLLTALRPLVRDRHPALDGLSPGSRAQLATILPGLDAGGADSRGGDGRSSDQMRLFEAMLELIDRLTEDRGLVLVLEDMHWADRSTRTFISFLARSLRREPVCIVLTYRADELHRRHPLRPLLSELERLERARRIELAPFDRDELAEALSDILGARPEHGLLERLYARGEGNPLYTEELLAAGLDGRGAPPQSLRDAFLMRIERLSADAQRVARAVAVARVADEPSLAAVTELEPAALQLALREAVAEQVLVADTDGRFGFRHALLREALYEDLLPGERGALHIALAGYLQLQCGADDDRELERTAAIAGHYAAAGDQPNALRSTIAAARAATRAVAYGEAAHLGERALELWPRVENAEQVAGSDHVELLVATSEAHRMTDDRPRSVVLINEALRELDPDSEPVRYAELLGRLARMTWALNRGDEAVQIAERALALLPEDEGYVRPKVLAWLARSRFLRGRFRESIADGEAALRTAVAAGDAIAEAELLNTLGMARVSLGHVDEGIASLRRAQQIAREHCDYDSLAAASANLADMLMLSGRTTEALATAQEGLAEIPHHLARSHAWLRLTVSEMAFEAGDWPLAQRQLEPTPPASAGLLFMYARLARAGQALAAGDEDGAAACLDAVSELVAASSEPQWISVYGTVTAELLVRRRDLDGARAAIQEALDRIEVCTDDIARIAQVSAAGATVEAERAQRARDLREAGERREAVTRARLHVDRLAVAAQEGGPVEAARLALGKAELTRARGRSAPREWSRATAAWEAIQRPYPAAVARWREAEALIAADRRADAIQPARQALATARSLGAGWLEREVRTLADRARLRLDGADGAQDGAGAPSDGTQGANGAPVEDPFGLTPRERQVLALLAEGATNRQIGAALFMAEKTASVHVSRILAKLGVHGRTQAAAVAHRLHLA